MFDGKTFFPVTGTPIRKIACMMSPLDDADPVPLAVAILNAKSLIRCIWKLVAGSWKLVAESHRNQRNQLGRVRNLKDELPHVPRVRRTALGAQAAMQADVLVLRHQAARLLQRA